MSKKNPYIGPFDYFEQYRENIQALRDNPEIVQFDRLCYEVLEQNPSGKLLMQFLVDRVLIPSLVSMTNNPNYSDSVIHAEGMKETVRMLRNAILSHSQRIKAEMNTNDGRSHTTNAN